MAAGQRQPRRHVPARTCIGCREESPKRKLVRIVRTPELRLLLDESGRASGRGAYLCNRRSCWEKALKGGTIAHALRFTPPAEDLAALRAHGASLPEQESETI